MIFQVSCFLLFSFKRIYVKLPNIKALTRAKTMLPIRYCIRLFFIKSVVISDFSGKTSPPTKIEPIFNEPSTINGIIGGILTLEHRKANDLLSFRKTAAEMTISV